MLPHPHLHLRLSPHHPLLRFLHSSTPNAHAPPPPPPSHPHAADLWLAKALAVAFFLRSHHLPAFRRLAPSPLAAAAALRLAASPSSSLRLFTALHSSPLSIPTSVHSYYHLIAMLCYSRRHSDALHLFDEMTNRSRQFPDANFLSFLAGSCADAGLLDAAAALLSKATCFGCRIEAYAYNKLMSLFIGHSRMQDAVALFEQWLKEGVFVPDVWSFNVVIKGLCRLGEVRKAFGLVRRMREFGCLPDTVTHNIIVNGLCRAKQVDKGHEVLRQLQVDGVSAPNVVMYTSVISGYCKTGRMDDAMAVYNEMVGSGITPNNVTYNVLIDGYGKVGDMGSAAAVYQQMMLRHSHPDVVTFSSLIDGYCRCGQLDSAMKLWNEMVECQIQPNAYTFAIMIHSLCKQNRSEKAQDLLRELNARADIAPHAFIYNPLIDVLCKVGKVDEANLVLAEMEGKRCRPDKYTYTILIIGHCMKGRISEATTLFHKMMETGCSPDSVTVNSFISCLLKAGMPSEVDRIMLIASGSASYYDAPDTSSGQKVLFSTSKSPDFSVAYS